MSVINSQKMIFLKNKRHPHTFLIIIIVRRDENQSLIVLCASHQHRNHFRPQFKAHIDTCYDLPSRLASIIPPSYQDPLDLCFDLCHLYENAA